MQPFDPEKRRTTGQAVAILNGIVLNGPSVGEFALSANGGLLYQAGGSGTGETLVIRGEGRATQIPLPEPGNYEDPTFSPDGRRIAVSISRGGSRQIWIWDRDQRTQQLLTVEGEVNRRPVWSPDGTRIAFGRQTEESTDYQIYLQPADGSGAAERLLETEGGAVPKQFSADGDSLLIMARSQTTQTNIGLLSLPDGTIRWLVETSADDYQPQISPDGRWLAHTSTRSGQAEVYVQAMDGTGGRVQVSAGGGHSLRWAPDGTKIYIARGVGEPIIAAHVSADEGSRVTGRDEMFEAPDDLNPTQTTTWDVSPDGEEFVYINQGGTGASAGFVWILDWPEMLEEMGVGGGR